MIDEYTFRLVRDKYGHQASWAVWGDFGNRPKDNMDDLSMFADAAYSATCSTLHTNYVLVGLNISTIDITVPLSNFHGKNGEVYKLRFALHNTPIWGAYMTDVLKDYKNSTAQSVEQYLKTDEGMIFESANFRSFKHELFEINASYATLIALGRTTFDILTRGFQIEPSKKPKIIKIDHYGFPVPKEKYKARLNASLCNAGLEMNTGGSATC